MASKIDVKVLLKHIMYGTLDDKLCRVCLLPLDSPCENIFTKIVKEDQEYCIADVIRTFCEIEIPDSENCSVCSDCFVNASTAYQFYILMQRSSAMLNVCVNEVQKTIDNLVVGDSTVTTTVCISLPTFILNSEFSYLKNEQCHEEGLPPDNTMLIDVRPNSTEVNEKPWQHDNTTLIKSNNIKIEKDEDDDHIIMIKHENGESTFYRAKDNGLLIEIDDEGNTHIKEAFQQAKPVRHLSNDSIEKRRRTRLPMKFRSCPKCPIRYRFLTKLKEHMKSEHNSELFVCKVCKAVTESEEEHNKHLETHVNCHPCPVCNKVFKKQDTIESHMKMHEDMQKLSSSNLAHMCEICGDVHPSQESLDEHHKERHSKNYTCYYCGRMYKLEISFEKHIKKHEIHLKDRDKKKVCSRREAGAPPPAKKARPREHECATCGRGFVDERSLLWHRRLHTDERPYTCETCGRGFVSLNRRNQHALCSHSAPAHRCPLCPALFHLRSMVNTHIKKVHLKAHKRRKRASKYQQVSWRTEPVPLQELSVDVQDDILELQTGRLDEDE